MIRIGLASIIALTGMGITLVHGPSWTAVTYEVTNSSQPSATSFNGSNRTTTNNPNDQTKDRDERPTIKHVPIPEEVRAIYMTACVAGTPSFRQQLVELVEATELNSIMIDIKDYSGRVSFPIEHEVWGPAWQTATCGARDMEAFIADLHERGIFVIGRITVFQDPFQTNRRP